MCMELSLGKSNGETRAAGGVCGAGNGGPRLRDVAPALARPSGVRHDCPVVLHNTIPSIHVYVEGGWMHGA